MSTGLTPAPCWPGQAVPCRAARSAGHGWGSAHAQALGAAGLVWGSWSEPRGGRMEGSGSSGSSRSSLSSGQHETAQRGCAGLAMEDAGCSKDHSVTSRQGKSFRSACLAVPCAWSCRHWALAECQSSAQGTHAGCNLRAGAMCSPSVSPCPTSPLSEQAMSQPCCPNAAPLHYGDVGT